jgi:hypothetical protein
MNKDKVGLGTISLSLYISSSFTWISYVFFHLSYRQTKEGIAHEDMLKENYLRFLITVQGAEKDKQVRHQDKRCDR